MDQTIRKRGQRIARRFTRFSKKAGRESTEHIKENVVDRFSHIRKIRLLILEWSLLIIAIIMLSVTQAYLYAESYAVSSFTKGGTYSEATLGRINSLNPLFATTNSEKVLSRLMFATLSSVDYSGHIGLGLADSIKTDDSGSTWTVKLRDNLKWSDGEPITNDDVLYTVSVIQSPAILSSYSSNLSGVKVSVEDGKLIFKLPTAYANFSSALEFPILPAHILKDVSPNLLLEHTFSNAPITSGPFTYNATQTIGNTGEKIVYLAPNKDYYKSAPLLDSFAIHAYTSIDEIINAINLGTVTATAELSPTDSGVFAFLNNRSTVFSNKSIRKALQEGIDMRSLRAPLGDELPLDYPLLASQVDFDNFPSLPEYNPDAAKDIIAAANIPEDQPIRLVTTDYGYLPALAENLRFQLENLGLKV